MARFGGPARAVSVVVQSVLLLVLLMVSRNVVAESGAPPADAGSSHAKAETCEADKLTVYKVVLTTYWSRDKFPKHYPDWRPPAQWSKVFGRSHDKSYVLFRLGQKASVGIKAFSETGRSDLLEEQSQGEGGIYDEFNAPPIAAGVGRTEAEFFVDGNHSSVSLISRIVPSPDWFVGIDSFDLCVNGNWLDSITIEVDPVDAGTDNGFTFTAPNWATEPQGVIYRFTSKYPSHPAGSFFYPHLNRLPPIATFQFIKSKEYELSEVFHHDEDGRYEVVRMEHLARNTIDILNNNDIAAAIEEEREEHDNHARQYPSPKLKAFTLAPDTVTTTPASTIATFTLQKEDATVAAVIPRGDKDAILTSIVDTYRTQKEHRRRKYRNGNKVRKNGRKTTPRDCRVSDWGEWSQCSKSCGIGEMQRRRDILKHARRGGQPCPPLVETKWCGSARSCKKSYFTW